MKKPARIGRLTLFSLAFLILFTGIFSCDSYRFGGSDEGIIEYDTQGVDPAHPLYGFAPSSAVMKFKGDKFIVEMSTMGMFNTTIMADNKAKTITQTVKFLDLKQACIENESDIMAENEEFALTIEETDETKEIIGLKCHKLNVTKVNHPAEKFEAWYTKELGMENCNALTPYAQVHGMLIDYRIERMGMELHFLAKSYKNAEVPDKTFQIPPGMKMVSKEEMQKFIDNLK